MKKFTGILVSAALVLGFASGVGAQEKDKSPKYKQEFHVGEKALKTFKDKDTGVVVDVYESFINEPAADFPSLVASGTWNLVGTDYWTMNNNGNFYWDALYNSTGGDYMFRVPAHSSSTGLADAAVILYENDGAGVNTRVTSWEVKPQSVSYDYVVRSIGGYVDGSDNRAEFHTYHESGYYVSGGTISNVKYYD